MVELPPRDRPVLTTERLELWLPSSSDIGAMIDIVTHEETGRYLGPDSSRAEHFTRFQRNAGSWLLFGYGGFIVRERGRPEVIGNCGIFHSLRGLGDDVDDMPEAGWIIAADHAGEGYAREAMAAAIDWFEAAHGKQPVFCMIEAGNVPSFALAERLGFARLRHAEMGDGADIVLLMRDA